MADPTAESNIGYTPIYLACRNGHDDAAIVLLNGMTKQQLYSSGVNNRHGNTLLRVAARGNCPQIVRRLIQYAKEDGTSETLLSDLAKGGSVCYKAIAFGRPAVVSVLLEHGASTEGVDKGGNRALHWAAFWGMMEAARYILDHGNEVQELAIANKQGKTPVMRAAGRLQREMVSHLLFKQDPQRISGIDTSGWQALHWAAKYERFDIIRLMVAKGADVSAKDSHGLSAADIARQSGSKSAEMLELLNDSGLQRSKALPRTLDRPSPEIAVKSVCKHALVHLTALYPNAVIQESCFSVHNVLYEHGPDEIIHTASTAQHIQTSLTFTWIHLPANNVSAPQH